MNSQLSHAHQATYDAILRHPVAHNLQWRDVRSLLSAIGQVEEEPNGKLRVTRHGHTLVVHPSQSKDVSSVDEVKQLRDFIEASNAMEEVGAGRGNCLLVVIDHREARIYKAELHGTIPERIVPFHPDGGGRYLHNVDNDANGQRRGELRSYYEDIARAVKGADGILLFGSGTGASSAMEHLLENLKTHHPETAAHVIGAESVDEHHLTEDQLLAMARKMYAAHEFDAACELHASMVTKSTGE